MENCENLKKMSFKGLEKRPRNIFYRVSQKKDSDKIFGFGLWRKTWCPHQDWKEQLSDGIFFEELRIFRILVILAPGQEAGSGHQTCNFLPQLSIFLFRQAAAHVSRPLQLFLVLSQFSGTMQINKCQLHNKWEHGNSGFICFFGLLHRTVFNSLNNNNLEDVLLFNYRNNIHCPPAQ